MKTSMENESKESSQNLGTAPSAVDESLPQAFVVKYLGKREAKGLWGVKHTRAPVDDMVSTARSQKPGSFLPFLQLTVGFDGVTVNEMPQNQNKEFDAGPFPVDIISYGVQDVVYTRVFAMIVVKSNEPRHLAASSPATLECHAFVCDSRHSARHLTFALASAFKAFSRSLKGRSNPSSRVNHESRKFAIDLRSPDEIRADLDSEA